PISVVMPALEMAQETGKLIAWRKKEGESVAKGETLLEVETDKAVMEIEAPGDGILAGVRVREGAEVPVGQTIAWIVRPGEALPTEVSPAETSGRAVTSATRAAAPDLDSTGLVEVLERLAPAIEKKHGVRPTVTDLLTAAIARVLRKHPRLNASWSGNGIRLNKDINIGIAMAVDEGVVAVVIH